MTNPTPAATPSIKDIKEALGYPTLKAFSADWKALTDTDKAQIRGGIVDGSLTY